MTNFRLKNCIYTINTVITIKQWNEHRASSFFRFTIRSRLKELSLCQKLRFSHPNIFATQWTLDISNFNSVLSKNIKLKYQNFTASGFKDVGIIKFDFVARTQFLW